LRVRSTAYGTITVWLTASAGILLVVLAGRRIVRRIRGELGNRPPGPIPPDPPPTDRPQVPPGPPRGGPGAHLSGDSFPDPLATTERLPPVRPRRDGPPRPPGPPRVPSP
jgi:hypothetical protein